MESIIKALAEELGVEESEFRSWLNFRATEGKVIAEPKTYLGPRFKNIASAVQGMVEDG